MLLLVWQIYSFFVNKQKICILISLFHYVALMNSYVVLVSLYAMANALAKMHRYTLCFTTYNNQSAEISELWNDNDSKYPI